MSYAKQTWTTGDIITAEKLNHIEDGIVSEDGEFLKVYIDLDSITAPRYTPYKDVNLTISYSTSYEFESATFNSNVEVCLCYNGAILSKVLPFYKGFVDNSLITGYALVFHVESSEVLNYVYATGSPK